MSNLTEDIIIARGSIISNVSNPILFYKINEKPTLAHIGITFENKRYLIAANTFIPINTEKIFHESFLTNTDPQEKIWINSYLLEVLQSGDRYIIMQHEQRMINQQKFGEFPDKAIFHSIITQIPTDEPSLIITHGTISIGGFFPDCLIIKQIEYIPNGYRVAVTWDPIPFNFMRSMTVNLPNQSILNFYLYFYFDGDYIDIYYSSDIIDLAKYFSSSFVLIDSEMRKQLNEIIQTDPMFHPIPFDPSRITFWPRRADGSMDIPHHPLTKPLNSSSVFVFNTTVVNAPSFENLIIENNSGDVNVNKTKNSLASNEDAKVLPFWI